MYAREFLYALRVCKYMQLHNVGLAYCFDVQ